MPSILYSTGSSIVIIFLFLYLNSFNNEYTVVVFPLPVAPVINNIPIFLLIILLIFSIASLENPNSSFFFRNEFLFNILSTIFSPYTVGILDALTSISSLFKIMSTLPSCGILFSVISIDISNFITDDKYGYIFIGNSFIFLSSPSILNLIVIRFSNGSI
ncbi:hypothetical protein SDC9_124355 [bioreactor metagenome]|uniref:Uncharacterized protein n=1 Tax=bioreactor metagenome TaxID=1076179 RepID=A0A645CKS0_9ZZZZ